MRTLRSELVCLAGLVVSSGCVVGPKYHAPAVPVPSAYKESAAASTEVRDWKVASPQDAIARGTWWEIFDDLELNALEEQIDAGNQTIAQAYQNYMAARALTQQARAARFPTVTASPTAARSRSSATLGAGTLSAVTITGRRATNLPFRCVMGADRGKNQTPSTRPATPHRPVPRFERCLAQHAMLAQLFFRCAGRTRQRVTTPLPRPENAGLRAGA